MSFKISGIQILIFLFGLMILSVQEDIPSLILFFTIIPAILRLIKFKTSNIIINLFMFVMLILTYLNLGPSLNAEMALSFFMIITSCKILQCHSQREFFITQLILLICLIGAGLFNGTIIMAVFMATSIILIISMIGLEEIDVPLGDSLYKSLINSLKAILLALPIAVALFFFFPRFRSFVPTVGANLKGKIGHNKEVKNDQIAELLTSSSLAFRAKLNKKLKPSELYWRGRVLSKTDGYNWFPWPSQNKKSVLRELQDEKIISYSIKLEQDLYGDLFVLDYPVSINSKEVNIIDDYEYITYRFNSRKKILSYNVKSVINNNIVMDSANLEIYLRLPRNIKKNELKNLVSFEQTEDLTSIRQKLESFFTKNNFLYSLAPGKMNSLQSFIKNKKGYCTHYASLTAILLRLSNIPSRLVNGFQGGEYNPYSGNYIVRSNDAHTWVEIYLNGKWNRFDPTELVAPDRIRLGGEIFLSPYPFSFIFDQQSKDWILNTALMQKYNQIKLYFDYLDMQFNQFLQDFNKAYQNHLSKLLGLELYQFYLMAIWIPIIISFIYFLLSFFKGRVKNINATQKLLFEFKSKLLKSNIDIPDHISLENYKNYLPPDLNDNAKTLEIIDYFIQIKYQKKKLDLKKLKIKIKSLRF